MSWQHLHQPCVAGLVYYLSFSLSLLCVNMCNSRAMPCSLRELRRLRGGFTAISRDIHHLQGRYTTLQEVLYIPGRCVEPNAGLFALQ